jgi:hypothetical protein
MFVARATTFCRLQRSRMCPRSDPLKRVLFLKRDVEFPQQTQIFAFERLLLPLDDVSDDSVELRPVYFRPGHIAPLEQGGQATALSTNILPRWGRGSGLWASTNILPRWGRGIGTSGFYKHTAPLGQGIGTSGFYKHTAPLGQGDRDLGESLTHRSGATQLFSLRLRRRWQAGKALDSPERPAIRAICNLLRSSICSYSSLPVSSDSSEIFFPTLLNRSVSN